MKALLLSSGPGRERLASALRESGVDDVVCVSDAAAAREALQGGGFEVLLLAGGGAAAAAELAALSPAGTVALVPRERYEEALPALSRAGVLALAHPPSRAALRQAIFHAAALYHRLHGAAHENERLRGKLDETKLVERAKMALMQYLNMSEAQAHRYIEKQAMDRRVPRIDVALSILANYGV